MSFTFAIGTLFDLCIFHQLQSAAVVAGGGDVMMALCYYWYTDGTLMHWNGSATLKILVISHKNLILSVLLLAIKLTILYDVFGLILQFLALHGWEVVILHTVKGLSFAHCRKRFVQTM